MPAISAPTAALVTAGAAAKTASDALVAGTTFTDRCASNTPVTNVQREAALQATITAQLAAITALSAELVAA